MVYKMMESITASMLHVQKEVRNAMHPVMYVLAMPYLAKPVRFLLRYQHKAAVISISAAVARQSPSVNDHYVDVRYAQP